MNILTVEQAKEYVCNLPFELAIVNNQPCVKFAEGKYTTDLKGIMKSLVETCMVSQSNWDRLVVKKGLETSTKAASNPGLKVIVQLLSQELDNALNIYNEKMD